LVTAASAVATVVAWPFRAEVPLVLVWLPAVPDELPVEPLALLEVAPEPEPELDPDPDPLPLPLPLPPLLLPDPLPLPEPGVEPSLPLDAAVTSALTAVS